MGMLLHRHYAEPAPEKPIKEPQEEVKDEAATAKKPGRPKKSE